jgi:hypothetical protein
VNALGLYTLDRKIRPVGEAYRKLVEEWRDLVPMMSRRLDVHGLDGKHQRDEVWRRAQEKETGSRARARMRPGAENIGIDDNRSEQRDKVK